MERAKVTYNPCDECRYSYSKQNQESYQCKVCEFKTYVDAERQGLIIVLPCKVGDVVYTASSYMECCREECKWVEEECDECCDYQRVYFVKETKFQIQMIAVFGKTVFLTKEEAEQAIEKMEKNNNE